VVGAHRGRDRHPMYSNAAGMIPVVQALWERRGPWERARLYDERHRLVAAGNPHPAKGAQASSNLHLCRRCRLGILIVGYLFT